MGKSSGLGMFVCSSKKHAFLSVYVDDFKMAGKAENLAGLWAALKTKVDLDPPSPMNHQVYLGCNQHGAPPITHLINEKQDMFRQLITAKVDQSVAEGDLLQADRVQSSEVFNLSSQVHELPPSSILIKDVKAWSYEMIGHTEKSVEAYCKLANASKVKLKAFETPCVDDSQLSQADHKPVG